MRHIGTLWRTRPQPLKIQKMDQRLIGTSLLVLVTIKTLVRFTSARAGNPGVGSLTSMIREFTSRTQICSSALLVMNHQTPPRRPGRTKPQNNTKPPHPSAPPSRESTLRLSVELPLCVLRPATASSPHHPSPPCRPGPPCPSPSSTPVPFPFPAPPRSSCRFATPPPTDRPSPPRH